ncbi:MAG: hypothetical protein ABI981_06710 [Betaproteobacteria bacterium]
MPGPEVPPYLELADGYSVYLPRGEVSLTEAVGMVTDAIAYCQGQSIVKLLVDTTLLTGYSSPTLHDRYWMAQDWAAAAQGSVTVAVVAHAQHIHPDKFGIQAAADAGMTCDVFTAENDAVVWLLQQR